MKTCEYRLYPNKEQAHLLMQCLIESRLIYNQMLETIKQHVLCRRKKGSHRRRKAARNAAKTHLKITRQRRDHHFKTAQLYAEGYHHIIVEDLQITNMVKNHHLAKSIMDASWGQFLAILEAKAASAGHQVIRVNPRFTSQHCFQCGEIVQKSLSVRTHSCPCCVTPVKGHHLSGEQSPTSSGNGSMPNVSLTPERRVRTRV